MPYMVTFTINIPQMLAYIPYMDPMGNIIPNYSYDSLIPYHSSILLQSYSANNVFFCLSGDTPKIDALHRKIVLKWMV